MRKLYTILPAAIFFCTLVVKADLSYADRGTSLVDTTKNSRAKITDTRPNKPAILKNGIGIKVVPFKPNLNKTMNSSGNLKNGQPEKVLNNVKVYPNPVADQLNLSYQVTRESNVTIKIMDVLGNEVATLLSQKQSAGEKNPSFEISSRLSSGFYFVRLIVGNETVVKRISVQ
ncbi:MAG TPA: T9SS type A sorting domain-containing protein [Sphingobacteriaceae bacterium]